MSSLAVLYFVPVFLAVFAEKNTRFILGEVNTFVASVRSTEGFESKDTWPMIWQMTTSSI